MRYSSMATKRRLASGQRKVDLSCLPEEFGEFFGGIRCADRLQILFEPTSAISAQDDRLPQQFHSPADAAWCVVLDDRGHVVGRRRDTAVASSRALPQHRTTTGTGQPGHLHDVLDDHRQSVRPIKRFTPRHAAVRFVGRCQTRFRVGGCHKRIQRGFTMSMRARCASMTSRHDTVPADVRCTNSWAGKWHRFGHGGPSRN